MINVIGLGYIGLPTALMLAKSGVEVVGTDINSDLVNKLNQNELTFEEKGLNELFSESIKMGVRFTTEYVKASLYIVTVPTPYIESTKKVDPCYVMNAIKEILSICNSGATIIIESTISPGTIDKFIRPEITKCGYIIGHDIHLVHAPERIIPGNMVYELINNSRTIGCDDLHIGEIVKEIYSKFCENEIIITDIRSAEMSKVVENTYRDINIAYANELAKICRHDEMDVYEIIRIANKHPRVNILQPGPGVGGHCISVDPWFLVGDYPDLTNLILSARKINDSMPEHVLKRIRDIMKENSIFDLGKIGLYGLTYKENVDDTRESPTLQLLKKMDDHLAFGVKVFDPWVTSKVVENQMNSFDEFIQSIEICVILVAHDHIKINAPLLEGKLVLDTKKVIDEGTLTKKTYLL